MTPTTTHWYLFSRPTELQTTLMQCDPQTLLTPYQLFRFELTGDGRCFLLLALEGSGLPQVGQLQPLVLQQKKGEQHNPILSSHSFQHLSPSAEDWSADSFRLSFHAQDDKSSQYMGWAFPLRHGDHLLASVGLEEVPAYTSIAWALFQVPTAELHDSIANHLSLGRHDIRCSPAEDGKHWLLIREPELYLVLKWKTTSQVVIYQSFPEAENLMTPWGYRTPLRSRVQLSSPQSLLVLNLAGGSQWLDTSSWWQPSEIITLPPQWQSETIPAQAPPTQVAVKLRYLQVQTTKPPRLWVLQGAGSLAALEDLVLSLHPGARAALQVFAGIHPQTQEQLFLLIDNRSASESPLFSEKEDAIGFQPLLDDVHLFVQSGYKIQPTLPAAVWQRDLNLSPQHYTLLLPPDTEQGQPQVLQFERASLVPFETLLEYRIGGEIHAIQELARATTFAVMFDPQPIPRQMPTLQTSGSQPQARPAPSPGNAPSSTLFPPGGQIASETESSKVFRHPHSLVAQAEQLQRLELSVRTRNQRKSAVTPKDWLMLGELYFQEYHKQGKEKYWAGEAILCLDQVFNLDRYADKAVALERSITQEVLQLPKEPLTAVLQKLEQHTQGASALHKRLAFRYVARLLMLDELPPDDTKRLRQKFYFDLAQLDDILLTMEHRIYVEGVARLLDDHELVARARQRYRTRIDTNKRIWQELPHVVRP